MLDAKDHVGHVDRRAACKRLETHELPEVAFIMVNQDVWRTSCESGVLLPRGALQNVILTWYHKGDPRSKVYNHWQARERQHVTQDQS